jgi:hypothetical protein
MIANMPLHQRTTPEPTHIGYPACCILTCPRNHKGKHRERLTPGSTHMGRAAHGGRLSPQEAVPKPVRLTVDRAGYAASCNHPRR